MENYNKIPAIILSVKPYKENDKMALAFTAEFGKINIVFKGAAKKGAKLNSACQIFCFADFTLSNTNGFFTVTGAEIIDTFFDLSANLDKFFCAGLALEFCDKALQQKDKNADLFVTTLKCLQELCYSSADNYVVALKFMLEAARACGYKQTFGACVNCKNKKSIRVYIDAEAGGFLCNNCRRISSVNISFDDYNLLKRINEAAFEGLDNINVTNPPVILSKALAESMQNLFDIKLNFIDNISINEAEVNN